MSGKDSFLKTGAKLKAEVQEKKDKQEKALAVVMNNPALAKMFRENAQVGSANLQGELPQLKIHTANKSQNNILADGTEATDGYFYYRPTKEQFKELDCHILTISRGYRTEGFEGKKDVFHQIAAGVITNGGDMKPFIMYFTGLKLENLWNFGKEASPYTKNRQFPIPLFALKAKMTTEKVKHSRGVSWIAKFALVRHEDGTPDVITDVEAFNYLREQVDRVETTIAALIDSKSTEEAAVPVNTVSETDGIPLPEDPTDPYAGL